MKKSLQLFTFITLISYTIFISTITIIAIIN